MVSAATCPVDALKFKVCANVLGLIKIHQMHLAAASSVILLILKLLFAFALSSELMYWANLSIPLDLSLVLNDCGKKDPIVAPPPPEEVADQELPEGGDEHDVTVSHNVVSGAYPAAPPPPVPLVATVALPVPPADKRLKRVTKVFDLMKLTNADRMDNIHGLLQEYLIESYRKGKQDAFFRLFQGSLSIGEYVDQFEDLYGFVSDILLSEEAKCDRFRQGLHVGIRSSMTWFRGSNFRELVAASLNVKKVRQEEKEYE
ncbi:hypothetical protein GH714_030020 [Hevea brasiliensis]|uniref:Retrotransposon gag domain-containing protein n=1 Tax=Hevea brasiliensis TaxID=3981 RepID=A0A6A6LC43_HEVBR|nr:hypothetical protein GH714_030020 [Hevea brasiliensis]